MKNEQHAQTKLSGAPISDCFDGRDIFAAAALTGILSSGTYSPRVAAEQAYRIADAMIAERSRSSNKPETEPVRP